MLIKGRAYWVADSSSEWSYEFSRVFSHEADGSN